MRAVGLAQLCATVRQRLDLDGQGVAFGADTYGNITDAELTGYVQCGINECFEHLVSRFGDNYYYQTYTFTPVTGQQLYGLPFDFLKVLGVDVALDTSLTNWLTVKPYNIHERNLYAYATAAVYQAVGWTNLRYQLQGNNLSFIPAQGPLPSTCRILYVPSAPFLVNALPPAWAASTNYAVGAQIQATVAGVAQMFTALAAGTSGTPTAPSFNVPGTVSDGSSGLVWIYTCPMSNVATSFDGINGWEEVAILQALIECAVKQEHPTDELFRQKADVLARMDIAAKDRQAGDPDAITGGWGRLEDTGPWGGPFFDGGGGFGMGW